MEAYCPSSSACAHTSLVSCVIFYCQGNALRMLMGLNFPEYTFPVNYFMDVISVRLDYLTKFSRYL